MEQLVTEFVIGSNTFKSNLESDLKIHLDSLSEDFAEHPSKFAFYATAYEIACDYEVRLKVELERAYAKLDEQARIQLAAAVGKVTEKMVENVVITSADYTALQDAYLAAKKQAGLLRAAKDAMIHRKDMLVSSGANYRAELDVGPNV